MILEGAHFHIAESLDLKMLWHLLMVWVIWQQYKTFMIQQKKKKSISKSLRGICHTELDVS